MKRLVPADYDTAARILMAPSVAPFLRRVTPEKIAAMLESDKHFLLLPDPDVLFIAQPFIGECYMVHQAALPQARGQKVRDAGAAAVRWFLAQKGVTTLVGFTPSKNRAAILMAHLIGFSRVGLIPGAYGERGDAVVTAITRATLNKGPVGGGK